MGNERGFDPFVERLARGAARGVSRRSFLAKLGTLLAGASAVPLLPVSRASAESPRAPAPAEDGGEGAASDPASCEYWRHCAIDGFLCSCCGGSQTACPPGTEMAPVTWIGTCRNPSDGKDYIISYNDCCGRDFCGRCFCNKNEGDRPVYYPHRSNDINWCAGASTQVYHCSTALVVGVATEPQPEK